MQDAQINRGESLTRKTSLANMALLRQNSAFLASDRAIPALPRRHWQSIGVACHVI